MIRFATDINTSLSLESTKILLVPPKWEIIFGELSIWYLFLSQYWIFLYCSPKSYHSSLKTSLLHFLYRLNTFVLCFFSLFTPYIVIDLPIIATKLLLVSPKYEIIFSELSIWYYCNIGLFYTAPQKLSLFQLFNMKRCRSNIFAEFFVSI